VCRFNANFAENIQKQLKRVNYSKKHRNCQKSVIEGYPNIPKLYIPNFEYSWSRRIEWYIIWLWFGQQKGIKQFKPNFALMVQNQVRIWLNPSQNINK
jgi:hypothetical protein